MTNVQWLLAAWAAGLTGFWLYLGLKHDLFAEVWTGLMNVACAVPDFMITKLKAWFPAPAARSELERERKIKWLEYIDGQWDEIRMAAGDPVWHEVHGWVDAAHVCACGYLTECAVWCGSGHTNGQCSKAKHGYKVPGVTAVEFSDGLRTAFEGLRVAPGINAANRAYADKVRQALRDAGGAG